jgi:isoleucyl-tRNA synthetase
MALHEVDNRVKFIPAWGHDRMRNMLAGRPDWCVSRQRVWGVPIPAFYCASCNQVIADAAVIRHVADIFEKESADAWYKREARELLPENFACQCGGREFTKESDILDVWFDSGSSSIAVLEARGHLRWPADVYFEGGDQFRGWFNSSLMVGLAVHDRAPYDTILCHGWTLDAQGKAMHKSQGNAISPNDDVIPKLGAEVLRLWCVSSNYMDDIRCSAEILQRVSDGYRKLRNTARFALGNLDGFDPATDSVAEHEMLEIDRWALAALNSVVVEVRDAYEAYDFHGVYQSLHQFCTVTLSARYFDIIKDRLYTFAPKNKDRRSAQTALYRIVDALARMLAPILVFTSDEIWESLPSGSATEPSVHVSLLPPARTSDAADLLTDWAHLFGYRDEVLAKLEEARVAKQIGSSLEARVEISAGSEAFGKLAAHRDFLRYLFIVSEVKLVEPNTQLAAGAIEVTISRARGEKCERCWNYSTRVGEASKFPTVCERCVAALQEMDL